MNFDAYIPVLNGSRIFGAIVLLWKMIRSPRFKSSLNPWILPHTLSSPLATKPFRSIASASEDLHFPIFTNPKHYPPFCFTSQG